VAAAVATTQIMARRELAVEVEDQTRLIGAHLLQARQTLAAAVAAEITQQQTEKQVVRV
jgi:hypothetical protein